MKFHGFLRVRRCADGCREAVDISCRGMSLQPYRAQSRRAERAAVSRAGWRVCDDYRTQKKPPPSYPGGGCGGTVSFALTRLASITRRYQSGSTRRPQPILRARTVPWLPVADHFFGLGDFAIRYQLSKVVIPGIKCGLISI